MRADAMNLPVQHLPSALQAEASIHHVERDHTQRIRKSSMSRFFAALSLLVAFALPTAAFALPCKYYDQMVSQPQGSQYPVFPGDPAHERPGPFTLLVAPSSNVVKVNPKAPVGTVLATQAIGYSTIVDANGVPANEGVITCDHAIDGAQYAMLGQPTAYPGVFESGIPGLGIQIVSWPMTWGPGVVQTQGSLSPGVTMNLKYWKIGPMGQGGTLSDAIASVTIFYNNQRWYNVRFKDPIVIVPTIPTCSISTPDVMVQLDQKAPTDFASVGSTLAEKDFNVTLGCSGGDPSTSTTMHMFLTDQTTPANQTNILSLTPDSTAAGVGVQILNGTTPIVFGQTSAAPTTDIMRNIVVGTPTVDIPMKARYVRTGNVTAGTVTAIATFTTSYN
ncbi:fimbrial protein [Lysobacter soli]|uniref:fimbrial protein n=1 Tax=Lysobacter soli TaxID=453783 RepID=UPI0036C02FA6